MKVTLLLAQDSQGTDALVFVTQQSLNSMISGPDVS